MARTYNVQDAITLLGKLNKGLPTSAINVQVADMVHSRLWRMYPWSITCTTVNDTSFPLSDGVQDYDPPQNIFRLLKGQIIRTDTTPDQFLELDVAENISKDLTSRSYSSIRSIALQRGIGKMRLESAIQVPTNVTMYLGLEFQRNPDKLTSLSNGFFFDDQYLEVFLEGLLYWSYKLSDDAREIAQLGKWMAAITEMSKDEDFGATDPYFPSEGIGLGRDAGSGITVFGWS